MKTKKIIFVCLLILVLPLSSYSMTCSLTIPKVLLMLAKKSKIYQNEGAFVEAPAELTGLITGTAIMIPTMPITLISGDTINTYQASFSIGYYSAGLPFYLVKKTLWDVPIVAYDSIFTSTKDKTKCTTAAEIRKQKITEFGKAFAKAIPKKRMAITLKAINSKLITTDATTFHTTFEELKQMFGKRLRWRGDYKYKKKPFTCYVFFTDPINLPKDSFKATIISGWYINFYFLNESLENYALSNVHKTSVGLQPVFGGSTSDK